MAEASITNAAGFETPPSSASSSGGGRESSSPSQNPPGSAGSGKRVAVTPLSGGSSSEGEYSDFESDQIPPSPSSSTSSGPIYVRPPGFKHHGQEVQILTVKHRPSQSTVKLKKKIRRQPALSTDTNTFLINDIKREDGNERIQTIVQQAPSTSSTPKIDSPRGGYNSVQPTIPATPKMNSPRGGSVQQAATPTPKMNNPRGGSVQQAATPTQKMNSPRGGGGGSPVGVMGKLGITGTKPKARKDPLPMKLRALPQSFWQQPNAINSASPSSMYAVLPPLCKPDQSDVTELRPITPPSDVEENKEADNKVKIDSNNNNNNCNMKSKEVSTPSTTTTDVRKKHPRPPPRIVKVSPANTDLLCKLFDGVEASEKKKSTIRRGRPKRDLTHSQSKHLIKDDPYMIDALPVLSLDNAKQGTAPTSHLTTVSVKSGGRTFTLPSLSVDQNYPAILSELVKAL